MKGTDKSSCRCRKSASGSTHLFCCSLASVCDSCFIFFLCCNCVYLMSIEQKLSFDDSHHCAAANVNALRHTHVDLDDLLNSIKFATPQDPQNTDRGIDAGDALDICMNLCRAACAEKWGTACNTSGSARLVPIIEARNWLLDHLATHERAKNAVYAYDFDLLAERVWHSWRTHITNANAQLTKMKRKFDALLNDAVSPVVIAGRAAKKPRKNARGFLELTATGEAIRHVSETTATMSARHFTAKLFGISEPPPVWEDDRNSGHRRISAYTFESTLADSWNVCSEFLSDPFSIRFGFSEYPTRIVLANYKGEPLTEHTIDKLEHMFKRHLRDTKRTEAYDAMQDAHSSEVDEPEYEKDELDAEMSAIESASSDDDDYDDGSDD